MQKNNRKGNGVCQLMLVRIFFPKTIFLDWDPLNYKTMTVFSAKSQINVILSSKCMSLMLSK